VSENGVKKKQWESMIFARKGHFFIDRVFILSNSVLVVDL